MYARADARSVCWRPPLLVLCITNPPFKHGIITYLYSSIVEKMKQESLLFLPLPLLLLSESERSTTCRNPNSNPNSLLLLPSSEIPELYATTAAGNDDYDDNNHRRGFLIQDGEEVGSKQPWEYGNFLNDDQVTGGGCQCYWWWEFIRRAGRFFFPNKSASYCRFRIILLASLPVDDFFQTWKKNKNPQCMLYMGQERARGDLMSRAVCMYSTVHTGVWNFSRYRNLNSFHF